MPPRLGFSLLLPGRGGIVFFLLIFPSNFLSARNFPSLPADLDPFS
jgi:hypothetical protein